MPKPGRKPKPTPLKLLAGTRPCRINGEAPAPPAETPELPSYLGDVAGEEWARFVPQLAALGVLAAVDGPAIAIYCSTFERWRAALHAIDAHGLLIQTELGGLKANPAVRIAAACEAQLCRSLASFGCDPSSRSTLSVKDAPKRDELAEFMRAKG